MKRFAIAIDGPAGSGKSTAAREAAKRLGMVYVDTGAMYRTVALACAEAGIPAAEEPGVLSVLQDIDMRIEPHEDGQRIFLNGRDVTAEIRTPEIGKGASEVGAFRKVRERLVEIQQELAQKYEVVMDGRDIGTVVLPDAELKIYLDASVEERAKRRLGELRAQGKEAALSEVAEQIRQRDEADKSREHSPLRMAEDAVLLDSTGMDAEAVVQFILAEAEKAR